MFKNLSCSKNDLSERLGLVREKMHISQGKMAEKLGVTEKSVSNYENGSTRPNYYTLCDYAEIGGVSPNYLFGYGKEEMDINKLEDIQADINKEEILQKFDGLSKDKMEIIMNVIRL